LDCSGLVQFGKSRLVKVWYGRHGAERLGKARQGQVRHGKAGTERLVKASWEKARSVPVRHDELRTGMAGEALLG
jgi:hypothetical protein